MKRHLKWGIILFCTALSFGLAGCGKEEESMKEALERVRDAEEAEDQQDTSSAAEAGSGAEEGGVYLDQAIEGEETDEEREQWIAEQEEQEKERRKLQEAQEAAVRAMLEDQEEESSSASDSGDSGSSAGSPGGSGKDSSDTDENICQDCGYERLEVQCALCSGTGMTKYCKRCEGTGIICRNCFYPPSEPPASEDSSGTSSGGKGQRMCSRCNGDGYAGTCFSCDGNGYTSHSEFYDSYGTGGTTYEVTRPCYLCKNGERRCTLCKGTGWVDK